MFDIFFIISLFLFSALCFVEFLVFNEETLLALCFFSFIFFSFNSLGDSVVDTFQSRALKFESDLLLSFNLTKQSLIKSFDSYFFSRGFSSKFKVLSVLINSYLELLIKFSSFKLTKLFYVTCFLKLQELSAFEKKLFVSFQNKSISLLLYPLIFQTVKTNISLLSSLDKTLPASNGKISLLKSIS